MPDFDEDLADKLREYLETGSFDMEKTDISDEIKNFDITPKNEHDKSLIFALKKWLIDELNRITYMKVNAIGICFQAGTDEKNRAGADVSFCYNTEDNPQNEISGARWNFCNWKAHYFENIDDDDAVYGSMDMWAQFRNISFENMPQDALAAEFFPCAINAVKALKADGTIAERFGKDIPVLMIDSLELTADSAVYTALANDLSLLDEEYFDMRGCTFPTV